MRIILIGPFSPPIHGNSLANDVLYDGLLSRGYFVQKIDTKQEVISAKQGDSFSWGKILTFLKVYNNINLIGKSDVVYITTGHTFYGVVKYLPFILYSLVLKKRYLIHLHGNHLGKEYQRVNFLKKAVLKFCISNASACIALSTSLKINFENLIDKQKVHVVENFAQDILLDLADTHKESDKLRLLYLSNLMKEKGIIDFLDSLLLLKSKQVNFVAIIAGKIEEENRLEIESKISLLEESVSFKGVITGKDKIRALLSSNVFVLPTYYRMEGQPISIIEAMATGNILVVTKHSGIPDIVSESNGFFVESKSPESIADVLLDINNNLENMMHKFSHSNINYVKNNFTEDKFVSKILYVLDEVNK